jgi:hypothetical protein
MHRAPGGVEGAAIGLLLTRNGLKLLVSMPMKAEKKLTEMLDKSSFDS